MGFWVIAAGVYIGMIAVIGFVELYPKLKLDHCRCSACEGDISQKVRIVYHR